MKFASKQFYILLPFYRKAYHLLCFKLLALRNYINLILIRNLIAKKHFLEKMLWLILCSLLKALVKIVLSLMYGWR